MTAIKLDHVDFAYASVPIIRGLSVMLKAPSVVGLVGRSGSGKTTLLKLLAGILKPSRGSIQAETHRVSWVPQDAGLFPWLTISENIAFPLTLQRQFVPDERRASVASRLCSELRLSHAAERYPAEASGGEKQRAAIARAIAGSSDLLLLDEPFASLDPMARTDLRQLLREITAANQMITVFASHDLFDVATLADRVLVIPNTESPEVVEVALSRFEPGRLRSQELAGKLVKAILMTLEPC